MAGAVGTLTRRAFRDKDAPLNILYLSIGNYYEQLLLGTGHNFHEMPTNDGRRPVDGFDFDLVISQSRHAQLTEISRIAAMMHLPLLSIDCDIVDRPVAQANFHLKADLHVFNSNVGRMSWRAQGETKVIAEAVDSAQYEKRVHSDNIIITDLDGTVPDFCLNVYTQIHQSGMLHNIRQETRDLFPFAKIYVNFHPVLKSVEPILRAMAAGCVVISVDSPFIREIIVNKYNGFLVENDQAFLNTVNMVMNDQKLAQTVADKGRYTADMKFSVKQFNKQYNEIFTKLADKLYLGV